MKKVMERIPVVVLDRFRSEADADAMRVHFCEPWAEQNANEAMDTLLDMAPDSPAYEISFGTVVDEYKDCTVGEIVDSISNFSNHVFETKVDAVGAYLAATTD